MEVQEQIEVAFLAVNNNHISFKALCNNFPLREIRKFLEAALEEKVSPLVIGKDTLEFYPHDKIFYWTHYKEFVELCRVSNPEVFI